MIVLLFVFCFLTKACDIGRYGLNCQHVCGHCFKTEQCFHTNRSCSAGCMEEYRGEMCLESIGMVSLNGICGETQCHEIAKKCIYTHRNCHLNKEDIFFCGISIL